MKNTLRSSLLLALGLFVVACDAHDTTPAPAALEPRCNRFQLANGQFICLHSRPLGAITRVDHQHAGAAVEALTDPNFSGPLESSVDLRTRMLDGCLQVRNQGECGWCVAHAVGAALDGLYCAEGCPPARVSMPALWEQGHGGAIGDNDCVPGWQTEDALAAASNGTPLPSEEAWAYSGTPRSMEGSRPSDDALMMDPRFGATGHGSVPITNDAAQIEQMKRVLSSGRVLVVWSGVCFNNGWQNGTTTIQAPTGNCAANGTDQYDGYHAYTIVGYDDATMEFIGLNSWGQSWGQGGYMRLSYGFAQQELQGVGYLDQIDRTHGGCEMTSTDPTTTADRCAEHDTCDDCAATSGCVFCDGSCVAADATRTGPATGTCTTLSASASSCPVPSGDCAMHASCDECANAGGCAWCAGRGICVGWPDDHLACDDGGRVATQAEHCNDTTHACEGAMDCATCSALSGCGWCDGTAGGTIHAGATGNCFGGAMNGPDRVACDAMNWSLATGMCPMPDAGMGDGGGDMDGGVGPMPDGGAMDPCASLGCSDCVFSTGCGFCRADGLCYGAGFASACAGGTTTDVAACDQCHDLQGTCGARADCCNADTNANIQCIQNFCNDTSTCVPNGSACEDGVSHCCGAALCGFAEGGGTACCNGPGAPCASQSECCGSEACTGGRCQPTPIGGHCLNTQECEGASYCLDDHTCGF